MTKHYLNIIYLLLFIMLTIATYSVDTFFDYSFTFFTFFRISIGVLCWYYFYRLAGHLAEILSTKIKGKKSKTSSFQNNIWPIIALGSFLPYLILMSIATDKLNDHLIKCDYKKATATINHCYNSKGTEYCVYSFSVNGKYYERKYNNEPSYLRLKENENTIVIYYTKFPSINKLEKEM